MLPKDELARWEWSRTLTPGRTEFWGFLLLAFLPVLIFGQFVIHFSMVDTGNPSLTEILILLLLGLVPLEVGMFGIPVWLSRDRNRTRLRDLATCPIGSLQWLRAAHAPTRMALLFAPLPYLLLQIWLSFRGVALDRGYLILNPIPMIAALDACLAGMMCVPIALAVSLKARSWWNAFLRLTALLTPCSILLVLSAAYAWKISSGRFDIARTPDWLPYAGIVGIQSVYRTALWWHAERVIPRRMQQWLDDHEEGRRT